LERSQLATDNFNHLQVGKNSKVTGFKYHDFKIVYSTDGQKGNYVEKVTLINLPKDQEDLLYFVQANTSDWQC
jgi:hypothetical protein